MKKNKNLYKIIIPPFIFIILFLVTQTTVFAANDWYYALNDKIGSDERVEKFFNSENLCLEDLAVTHSSWDPSLKCYQKSEMVSITNISPVFGKVGDIVTITGDNFTQDMDIFWNSTKISATSLTKNTLKITVPEKVTNGRITIKTKNFGKATNSTTFVVEDIHNLSSQINIENKDTYKLLAPIGKITEVKTNNIGNYFSLFFKLAIGLAGVLAVVMLVVGGIQWMGSESVFGKVNAKEQITSALLGLLIALGSYALLNTINPDLLGKKGLNVDGVNITLDPAVHGDLPHTPINGKYCNGKYTSGASWESDTIEREKVIAEGITINKNNCTSVGERDCTSLTGLDVSKIIAFKKSCGSNCSVVITGGTECWLHSIETQHLPGNDIVDLRISGVQNYIEEGSEIKKEKNTGFNIYIKEGSSFMKETNHYHVIKW